MGPQSTAMTGGSKVITKTNTSYLWYLNSINLRTFKIEIPLSRSRTYISSPEPPSFVSDSQIEPKAADSGSRADDAATTSRWKCLEVIPTSRDTENDPSATF